MVSKDQLSSQGRTETEKRLDRNDLFMGAIVLVTLLGFISLLVTTMSLAFTYQRDNANSYNSYREELRLQNDRIDSLTNELKIQNAQKSKSK
jgi:quinol-cytochrome oxidoreductase complex cytochrome b subunit